MGMHGMWGAVAMTTPLLDMRVLGEPRAKGSQFR
jgi:hypothetical protein